MKMRQKRLLVVAEMSLGKGPPNCDPEKAPESLAGYRAREYSLVPFQLHLVHNWRERPPISKLADKLLIKDNLLAWIQSFELAVSFHLSVSCDRATCQQSIRIEPMAQRWNRSCEAKLGGAIGRPVACQARKPPTISVVRQRPRSCNAAAARLEV